MIQKICYCKSHGLPWCNGSKVGRTSTDTFIYIFQIIYSHHWYDLMEMWLVKKLRICFDWSDNSGDFFRRKLVKIILTILRRNISPLKIKANVNAHAQIYFASKSPVILPNENPPLVYFYLWPREKADNIYKTKLQTL